MGSRLYLLPVHGGMANQFVRRWHRHHKPVLGYKFALAVADEAGIIHGVTIAGRPVSRHLDDGLTLEVTRVATDGTANACSALYGGARRVAKAMGYVRLITYTLVDEPGTSLRAAGWSLDGLTDGGSWDRPARPRTTKHPTVPKRRWSTNLSDGVPFAVQMIRAAI